MGRPGRIASGLMLVFFVYAIAVQYNDPDPIRWMAIYAGGAICCGLAIAGRLPWALPAVLAVIGAAWFAYWISGVLGQQPIWEEEGRESGGLLIVTVTATLLSWRAYRAKGSRS